MLILKFLEVKISYKKVRHKKTNKKMPFVKSIDHHLQSLNHPIIR